MRSELEQKRKETEMAWKRERKKKAPQVSDGEKANPCCGSRCPVASG